MNTSENTPLKNRIHSEEIIPWAEPVSGSDLLNQILALLRTFVVLPKWAAEALALWVVHTYAFNLRDTCAYIGIESPEKRCGKTTLLTVLSELVYRPVVAANISSPAWYRLIQEVAPTLLVDESDTFLKGNHALRGILNAGCKRKTAFVVRVSHRSQTRSHPSKHQSAGADPSTSSLASFSSWCPKALATIGRFPDTLADRCILIRMERKTSRERSERLSQLHTADLRRQCLRFVTDHADAIASAKPLVSPDLNDRAADTWEPLLALADLAGGEWPTLARNASLGLTASAQEHNPIGTLLLDIFLAMVTNHTDRVFSRTLAAHLNTLTDRPWAELRKGKNVDERWLSQILRPYHIFPKTIWIGNDHARGYLEQDFIEVFRRYIPKSEIEALRSELQNAPKLETPPPSTPAPASLPPSIPQSTHPSGLPDHSPANSNGQTPTNGNTASPPHPPSGPAAQVTGLINQLNAAKDLIQQQIRNAAKNNPSPPSVGTNGVAS